MKCKFLLKKILKIILNFILKNTITCILFRMKKIFFFLMEKFKKYDNLFFMSKFKKNIKILK